MAKQSVPRPLKWDEPKTRALVLIFEGRLSQVKVSENVGVLSRTLERWIAHPDFQAALAEKRAKLIAALDHKPYIRKERRLAALAEMAESAREQYEARPWLQEKRQIGFSPASEDGEAEPLYLINESFNRDAHEAFRKALDDIAKELGERSSSIKVSAHMEHSLVPSGAARTLAEELLAAVRDIPEARAALSARLLESGDAA